MTVTPRPPIRLALPGRICRLVTPPASAAWKPGSCGQIECSAQTCAVTGAVASLPSLCALMPGLGYTPRCEWMSMMPGVIHLPVASTRSASAGASRSAPTATIFPSRISTSALSSRVPVPVSTVACCSNTGGDMTRL